MRYRDSKRKRGKREIDAGQAERGNTDEQSADERDSERSRQSREEAPVLIGGEKRSRVTADSHERACPIEIWPV